MSKWTTIAISAKTKERLSKLGGKKDTYDQIVNRLLDEKEKSCQTSSTKSSR